MKLVHVALHEKKDFTDKDKIILDYLGEPNVIIRVLKRWKRKTTVTERQRR